MIGSGEQLGELLGEAIEQEARGQGRAGLAEREHLGGTELASPRMTLETSSGAVLDDSPSQ